MVNLEEENKQLKLLNETLEKDLENTINYYTKIISEKDEKIETLEGILDKLRGAFKDLFQDNEMGVA